LQEVEGELNRLDDVLRYEAEPELEASERGVLCQPRSLLPGPSLAPLASLPVDAPVKLTGHLELRKISFGYSPLDPPLLESFNLTLRPGARVALVGPSASGKSTVARIVSGLCPPWEGEVLLDGRPRAQIPRVILANSLAM